jgi:hypothetical protein
MAETGQDCKLFFLFNEIPVAVPFLVSLYA